MSVVMPASRTHSAAARRHDARSGSVTTRPPDPGKAARAGFRSGRAANSTSREGSGRLAGDAVLHPAVLLDHVDAEIHPVRPLLALGFLGFVGVSLGGRGGIHAD